MSFEQDSAFDGQKQHEEFMLSFLHICPRPDQTLLIEEFRLLCPWIQPTCDGYLVETAYLSDAAWQYLRAHQISFSPSSVSNDMD